MTGGALAILFFLFAHTFLSPPDTVFYWCWAESLFTDLDFYFIDEFARWDVPPRYSYITPTGRLANDWPPGTGFVIGPLAYLPPVFAHAWMVFLVFISVVFWIRETQLATRDLWIVITGLVAGTPLLFYLLFGPFFSHVPSFAATTVFLTLWARKKLADRSEHDWIVLGLLLGTSALLRPQNLLLSLVMLADLQDLTQRRLQDPACKLVLFCAMAFLAFAPQLVIWTVLYGSPLALPKVEEMHWLYPSFGKVLFSDFHGILPWTPLFAPAVAGLFIMTRRNTRLGIGLLLVLLVQLYINSANAVWWSGGSFGNRRMLDSAIIWGWGMIALLNWKEARPWRVCIAVVVTACSTWTTLLVLAERVGELPLSRYVPFIGDNILAVIFSTLSNPVRLIKGLVRWTDSPASTLAVRVAASLLLAAGTGSVLLFQRRPLSIPVMIPQVVLPGAALVLLLVVSVGVVRTPPENDPGVIEAAGTEAAVLWDNHIELAYYHARREEHQLAEEAARRAIGLRPNNTAGWVELGRALYLQERMKSAVEAFDKVLETDPDHALSRSLRQSAIDSAHPPREHVP